MLNFSILKAEALNLSVCVGNLAAAYWKQLNLCCRMLLQKKT